MFILAVLRSVSLTSGPDRGASTILWENSMSAAKKVILDELGKVRAELATLEKDLKQMMDEYIELKKRQTELVEAKRAL
jgi:predicted nuclease with TOPRIM domain